MPKPNFFLLSFLSVCFVTADAQIPVATHAARAPEVRLNVQVTSSGGQVDGLAPSDFSILDNKSAAGIVSVKGETPATEPVHAIILLDAVNVRYTELAYERDQVLRFLRSNGGKLAVPTAIAVLTNKGVELQKGFLQDGNLLAAGFEKQQIGFRTITRAAGFWGATERFETAANALRSVSSYAGTLPGRKFLLWVSPGWPLLSGPGVDLSRKQQNEVFRNVAQISNDLRNANVTLYAINPLGASEDLQRATYYQTFLKGVAKPEDAQLGNLGLQVLAQQSGGLALEGSTDVAGMLARCLQDSASWYEVRLARADSSGDALYHRVQLKVNKPGVDVRTRDGYYAEQ